MSFFLGGTLFQKYLSVSFIFIVITWGMFLGLYSFFLCISNSIKSSSITNCFDVLFIISRKNLDFFKIFSSIHIHSTIVFDCSNKSSTFLAESILYQHIFFILNFPEFDSKIGTNSSFTHATTKPAHALIAASAQFFTVKVVPKLPPNIRILHLSRFEIASLDFIFSILSKKTKTFYLFHCIVQAF